MPNLQSMSFGMYENKKGEIDIDRNPLHSSDVFAKPFNQGDDGNEDTPLLCKVVRYFVPTLLTPTPLSTPSFWFPPSSSGYYQQSMYIRRIFVET